MSSDLVKRLRDGNTLDIGEAADLIEALEGELFESRKVCVETIDAARKWRAKAEAAEARAERLRAVLLTLSTDTNISQEERKFHARKALEDDKQ